MGPTIAEVVGPTLVALTNADAPDPNDPDVQFSVAPELRQFLAEHGDLDWFLDALGFTSLDRTALNNNVGGPSR